MIVGMNLASFISFSLGQCGDDYRIIKIEPATVDVSHIFFYRGKKIRAKGHPTPNAYDRARPMRLFNH